MAIVATIGQLFLLAPSAHADPGEPGPYGRRLNYGYFFNRLATSGSDVIPGGLFVNNTEQFINAVRSRALNVGGRWSLQDIRGAQFIVQTMRGGGYALPNAAAVNDWVERVRGVASYNGIRFDEGISFRYNSYYQNAQGDDAFYTRDHGNFIWHPWTNDNGLVGNSITFRDRSGNIIYAIRKACGNPVGSTFRALENPWNFLGATYVAGNDQNEGPVSGRATINTVPGETVTFSHFIRLEGSAGNRTTRYTAWRAYPGLSNQPVTNVLPRPNPGNITLAPGTRLEVVRHRLTIPATATPGTQYCQYVTFQPAGSSNGGTGTGSTACARVVYSYNLQPSAQTSQTTGAAGDTVTVNYNVNNPGATVSRPTNWAIKEIIAQPGVALDLAPPYTDNNDAICSRYIRPGVTCTTIYDAPGTTVFARGSTLLPSNPGSSFIVGNYPAGTKICRLLAVDPPTDENSPRNRWSRPSCVVVGKRPTVHFMGGDISVGGGFASNNGICTVAANSGNIFTAANSDTNGSVVEYAAVARGTVQQFGSASKPDTSGQHFMATALTFANIQLNNPGNFGDNPHCITDYYAQYAPQVAISPTPVAPLDLASLGGAYANTHVHFTGNVTINTSVIPKGSRVLLVVDGNVNIAGDVTYAGPYGSTNDIPSLAIVAAGNITVSSNVRQLDGAFVTQKNLATCETPGSLTATICNNALVVNGLVIAETVTLRRTAGADAAASSDPAERFFYGSELFFNNVLSGESSQNTINTIEERDLPPRY